MTSKERPYLKMIGSMKDKIPHVFFISLTTTCYLSVEPRTIVNDLMTKAGKACFYYPLELTHIQGMPCLKSLQEKGRCNVIVSMLLPGSLVWFCIAVSAFICGYCLFGYNTGLMLDGRIRRTPISGWMFVLVALVILLAGIPWACL